MNTNGRHMIRSSIGDEVRYYVDLRNLDTPTDNVVLLCVEMLGRGAKQRVVIT